MTIKSTITKKRVPVIKRLRLIRLKHYHTMSLRDVASQIGINHSTLSGWETGRTHPNHDNIIALEDLFGKTYREMFTECTEEEIVEVSNLISSN